MLSEENKKILSEIRTLEEWDCDGYIKRTYPDYKEQVSKVNVLDNLGLFPCDKFNLCVKAKDDGIPIFHVITDNSDILVRIDNGEIVNTDNDSNDINLINYIKDNIQDWFNATSVVCPKLTNKEVAVKTWKCKD